VLHRLNLLLAFAAFAASIGFSALAVVSAADSGKKPGSVLDFHVKDIDGKPVDLSAYQGKVLLVVNTASQCGNTPQYKDLEAIYEKYKGQGFEVLAFPANEFGGQEPGSNEEIKEFCSSKYKVSFPLFSKIVVKGKGIHPLYDFLTNESTNPKYAGEIEWIARFHHRENPRSATITGAIEKALGDR
jgi:glutathione peroxidase